MARVIGNRYNNELLGTRDADYLYGRAGDDFLYGLAGDDRIRGGKGDDSIDGGAGDDVIDGGPGADRITGGDGNDTIVDIGGDAELRGGFGDDIISVSPDARVGDDDDQVTISGGFGDDIISVSLDAWSVASIYVAEDDDQVTISDGSYATLIGGMGYDTLTIVGDVTFVSGFDAFEAGFERLVVDGGTIYGTTGDDTIDFFAYQIEANAGVTISSGDGWDFLRGTAFGDTLLLGTGDDVGWGWDGDDTITAGDGNDFLRPGYGNDVVYGGGGDDHISEDGGADTLYGDSGDDWIENPSWSTDTVKVYGGDGDDFIAFTGQTFAALDGGTGTDTFWAEGNVLASFGAENGFEIYGGDFSVFGTDTGNILDFSGLMPGEFSSGMALNGGGGDDVLSGSIEADRLTGGAGADTFLYRTVDALDGDRILDFEDGDLLDLSAIDADPAAAGDQPFLYLGTAAFTGAVGEIRAVGYSEAVGWKYAVDTNGDAKGDVSFFVTAAAALTADDILL